MALELAEGYFEKTAPKKVQLKRGRGSQSKTFDTHVSYKSEKKVTKTILKWVHVILGNAKRNLLGVYHMISNDYTQNYLNEFCYRLNRRYFGENLFNRMVIAVVGN